MCNFLYETPLANIRELNMGYEKKAYYEILVISVGESPQIITQTLWYYLYNKIREFDRIVLVTTSTGKNAIAKKLFKNKGLMKLEIALGLKKGTLKISKNDLIVLKDKSGKELKDIRSSKNSEDEMQQIFECMKLILSDENTRAIVAVTGGRKTTSIAMALATSVYGRSQDEMINIIINEELLASEWFFPDNPNDKKQKVSISSIPYIKTGKYLKGLDVNNTVELINIAQTRMDEIAPLTKVVIKGKTILIDNKKYQIPPSLMMIWRHLARQKVEHCTREELKYCGDCNDCYLDQYELVDEFYETIGEEYCACVGENSAYWDNFLDNFSDADSFDLDKTIRENRSKLKSDISSKFKNPSIYQQIQVQEIFDSNDKRKKRYGIQLDKNAINFTD